MLQEGIGRLPVIEAGRLPGIVTRSDLLEGQKPRLLAAIRRERTRRLGAPWRSASPRPGERAGV